MIKLEIPKDKISYIRTIEGRKFKDGFWFFPDSSLPKLKELKIIDSGVEIKTKEFKQFDLSPHLRDYQKTLVNTSLNYNSYGIFADTGTGKCHGSGTEILMFNGEYKKVESIILGDLLMGDDSTPREVLSLARGQEKMYKVVPNKGESFVCNESHILSLRATAFKKNVFEKDQIINISIKDYLKQNAQFKHHMKLYKKYVEFQDKKVYYPPYIIGLWLGDGSKDNSTITNSDNEIVTYIKSFANEYNYNIREEEGNNTKIYHINRSIRFGENPFRRYLLDNCVTNNEKRIPKEYLYNSYEKRMEILSGLLDTDGYLTSGCFEIVTKYEGLMNDITFLAGSLGFMVTHKKRKGIIKKLNFQGKYYRIFISGNIDKIPCRVKRRIAPPRKQIKNVLNCGFTLEDMGIGDYYGFTITGNHLYFLKDFWITHNTIMGLEISRFYNKTLVICPLSIIECAWIEDCNKFYPKRKIVSLWSKSKKLRLEKLNEEADIYIINYDGLKIIYNDILNKKFDCMIVDESSKMKNMTSQITATLLNLGEHIESKYVLSGCPTPNHNSEIFPQIKLINPDIFGNNYYGFLAKYFSQDMENPHRWFQTDQNKDAFFERLREQSAFLRKEDCVDLPEKTFLIRKYQLGKVQQKYYDNMLSDIKDNINNWSKFEFTAKLMKLREIISGFVISKDKEIIEFETQKDNELENVLEEIGNKPVIIWCQFIHEIERLAKKFNGIGLTSKTKDRDQIISDFKNDKIKLLFVHPKLLGMGLTFTNCSYNVYYSLSFSYEEFKQSQDRIHRIGQVNKCTYIVLSANKTIDESIYKCLSNKKNVVDELYLNLGSNIK